LGPLLTSPFDVTSEGPLPRPSSCLPPDAPEGPVPRGCLPRDVFDVVVFSDVLYQEDAARGFGRRAAQALASGSIVVVADPGWRQCDFYSALHEELSALGLPRPSLAPEPLHFPEWAVQLSCHAPTDCGPLCAVRHPASLDFLDPFLLVIRPCDVDSTLWEPIS